MRERRGSHHARLAVGVLLLVLVLAATVPSTRAQDDEGSLAANGQGHDQQSHPLTPEVQPDNAEDVFENNANPHADPVEPVDIAAHGDTAGVAPEADVHREAEPAEYLPRQEAEVESNQESVELNAPSPPPSPPSTSHSDAELTSLADLTHEDAGVFEPPSATDGNSDGSEAVMEGRTEEGSGYAHEEIIPHEEPPPHDDGWTEPPHDDNAAATMTPGEGTASVAGAEQAVDRTEEHPQEPAEMQPIATDTPPHPTEGDDRAEAMPPAAPEVEMDAGDAEQRAPPPESLGEETQAGEQAAEAEETPAAEEAPIAEEVPHAEEAPIVEESAAAEEHAWQEEKEQVDAFAGSAAEEQDFVLDDVAGEPPAHDGKPFRFPPHMARMRGGGDAPAVGGLFVDFAAHAGKPASRDVLSKHYYRALESLYIHHNISEFAERAEQGVAKSGHSRLHFLLGVLYANGLGVVRSEAKAVLHYTFAAIQGVPEAHVALGHRHRFGIGVPRDCETAAMHLREAADAVAMTHDGRINPRPIERQAQRLANAGLSADTFSLTERDRDHAEATKRSRTLDAMRFDVERGNADAAVRLGVHYLHGAMGLRRDARLAERYLRRALQMREEAGREPLAEAYAYLGQIYAMGDATARPTPVPVDWERAVEYFRKGAMAGSGLALNGLGYLHVVGYLQHDQTPSERRRQLAEAEGGGGSAAAAAAAADRTPDFETAATYFARGVMLGRNAEAMYNLGVLHLHGRGVPVDLPRARALFEDAAGLGSMLSLWQLGLMAESRGECPRAVKYYMLVTRYGSWHNQGVSPQSAVSVNRHTEAATAATPSANDDDADGEGVATGSSRAGEGLTDAERAKMKDKAQRVARHRRMVSDLKQAIVRAGMGHDTRHTGGRDVSVAVAARLASFDGRGAEPTIARLVEQLALAETGSVSAAREAAVLLDEDLLVADEEESEETLMLDGVVEPGDPSFAHQNELPAHVPEAAAADTVVLQWRLPTAVRFSRPRRSKGSGLEVDDAEGEADLGPPVAMPWLVAQREAKRLLLLRLLHLSAADSTKSCLRLGDFYYYGESPLIGSDATVALHYYKMATRDNTAQAHFNVGLMHQLGIGVPPLRFVESEDGEESGSEETSAAEARQRNREAAVATAVSSPLMRGWTAGLAPSGALVRERRARLSRAAPNYVLQALLRLLESTAHNMAPLTRVWRYEGHGGTPATPSATSKEGGGGGVNHFPAVDLVAAVTPRSGDAAATSSSNSNRKRNREHFYYFDLNLAKRSFDSCLYHSHGSAFYAVRAALVLLNVQWWTLYFGSDVLKGIALHAAARLSSAMAVDGEAGDVSSAGRLLRLAKALVEAAAAQLFAVLSGASPAVSASAAARAAPGQGNAGATREGGGTASMMSSLSGLWQAAAARYVTLETYVLYALCAAFFLALVLQHHVA